MSASFQDREDACEGSEDGKWIAAPASLPGRADNRTVQATLLETDDFETLRERLEGWDHQYDLMRPGGFQGTLLHTRTGQRRISHVKWANQIRFQGHVHEGFFGVALTISGKGDGRWMGRRLSGSDILIQGPGQFCSVLAPREWNALLLAIPVSAMRRLASEFGNVGTPEFDGPVRLNAKQRSRLLWQVHDFLGIARTYAASPRRRTDQAALKDASARLERVLVAELLSATRPRATRAAAAEDAETVRRSELYVAAHWERLVSIEELCEHIGIRERSLHLAFHRAVGVSPAAWLRRLRLNRTFRQLRNTLPSSGAVKNVALGNGYFHMGHFSQTYKTQFRELPSETVMRVGKPADSAGWTPARIG